MVFETQRDIGKPFCCSFFHYQSLSVRSVVWMKLVFLTSCRLKWRKNSNFTQLIVRGSASEWLPYFADFRTLLRPTTAKFIPSKLRPYHLSTFLFFSLGVCCVSARLIGRWAEARGVDWNLVHKQKILLISGPFACSIARTLRRIYCLNYNMPESGEVQPKFSFYF